MTIQIGRVTLSVEPTDTIGSIVEKIQYDVKIRADQLKIVFDKKLLDKEKTLAECGIEEESTLILMVPMRGGLPPDEVTSKEKVEHDENLKDKL